MQLFLVRHGEATSADVNPARPLSGEGERQIRKLADFLAPRKLRPAYVWHSGKARAEGTARILARALAAKAKLLERKDIAPNDPPASVVAEINAHDEDLMLVGHLPFLSRLASALLTGAEAPELLLFHAGTIACLEHDAESGWRLAWVVHPGVV